MGLTTDPTDPRLGHGADTEPTEQNDTYLVLPEDERKKFVRPVRQTYFHPKCGVATTMSLSLAETYAADPEFFGASYCVGCRMHILVGDLRWEDGTVVGS